MCVSDGSHGVNTWTILCSYSFPFPLPLPFPFRLYSHSQIPIPIPIPIPFYLVLGDFLEIITVKISLITP